MIAQQPAFFTRREATVAWAVSLGGKWVAHCSREATVASEVSWGTKRGVHCPPARPGQATALPGRCPRATAYAFPGASSGCSGCIGIRAGWTAAGSMRASLDKSDMFRRSHQPTLRCAPHQVFTTSADSPPGNRRSCVGLDPAAGNGLRLHRCHGGASPRSAEVCHANGLRIVRFAMRRPGCRSSVSSTSHPASSAEATIRAS